MDSVLIYSFTVPYEWEILLTNLIMTIEWVVVYRLFNSALDVT